MTGDAVVRPKVVCPKCGKSVLARLDGSVSHHYPPVVEVRSERPVWCEGGYR